MTLAPSPNFMPRTPRAVRPITRTSLSLKRIALPMLLNNIISCSPSVRAVPTNSSSSSKSTAIMPLARGREKSFSFTRFTIELRVAINTMRSSSNSSTGKTEVMCSPSSNGKIFTIGLPRLPRLASGNCHVFCQYNFPLLEKHSSMSWVLATNSCPTSSSSFIAVADLPRPPRF